MYQNWHKIITNSTLVQFPMLKQSSLTISTLLVYTRANVWMLQHFDQLRVVQNMYSKNARCSHVITGAAQIYAHAVN